MKQSDQLQHKPIGHNTNQSVTTQTNPLQHKPIRYNTNQSVASEIIQTNLGVLQ